MESVLVVLVYASIGCIWVGWFPQSATKVLCFSLYDVPVQKSLHSQTYTFTSHRKDREWTSSMLPRIYQKASGLNRIQPIDTKRFRQEISLMSTADSTCDANRVDLFGAGGPVARADILMGTSTEADLIASVLTTSSPLPVVRFVTVVAFVAISLAAGTGTPTSGGVSAANQLWMSTHDMSTYTQVNCNLDWSLFRRQPTNHSTRPHPAGGACHEPTFRSSGGVVMVVVVTVRLALLSCLILLFAVLDWFTRAVADGSCRAPVVADRFRPTCCRMRFWAMSPSPCNQLTSQHTSMSRGNVCVQSDVTLLSN